MVKKRKAKNQGGAGDMDMGDAAAPSAVTSAAGGAKETAAAGFSAASAVHPARRREVRSLAATPWRPLRRLKSLPCAFPLPSPTPPIPVPLSPIPAPLTRARLPTNHKSPLSSYVPFPPPSPPTLFLLSSPLPLPPPSLLPTLSATPPLFSFPPVLPVSLRISPPPIPHPFPSVTSETMGFTVIKASADGFTIKAHKSPSVPPSPSPLSSPPSPFLPSPPSSPPPPPDTSEATGFTVIKASAENALRRFLPHPLPLHTPSPAFQTRVRRWGSQ
ncbi:unnamed protein product [Closterium sp. Naga37s-1]|nr:unnamed protein product [Closterium sp. Naga37s-1]